MILFNIRYRETTLSKMKFVIALVVLVAVVSARPGDDTYDSKYDDFDVEEMTDNDRLRKAYEHCFMDKGKCTPEGNDIKKWIPEGIKTSCGKCSDKQKRLVIKFLTILKQKYPEEYNEIIKHFDPEGKYTKNLEDFLKSKP